MGTQVPLPNLKLFQGWEKAECVVRWQDKGFKSGLARPSSSIKEYCQLFWLALNFSFWRHQQKPHRDSSVWVYRKNLMPTWRKPKWILVIRWETGRLWEKADSLVEFSGGRDLPAVLTLLPLHITPLCHPCCTQTAFPKTRFQGRAWFILQALLLRAGGGLDSEQGEYSAHSPQRSLCRHGDVRNRIQVSVGISASTRSWLQTKRARINRKVRA